MANEELGTYGQYFPTDELDAYEFHLFAKAHTAVRRQ
jgi:hypothetical protein